MKLLLICNFYSFFFEGLGQENVILGFRSNINKLLYKTYLSHICFAKSARATLWNPFFNFTFKNCKGACFFNFVRYFVSYFSSNIGNGLNPKMRKMDVWSRQVVTTPKFISVVLWKIKNFVHDFRRNIHFYFKNLCC